MSLKQERIAGIIRKEISEIIQFSLKDPSVGFVTVTDVHVSGDLGIAKIFVSFLGQEARSQAGLKALERAKGFMRTELGKRLTIRKVPELIFVIDEALIQGNKIDNLIEELKKTNKY